MMSIQRMKRLANGATILCLMAFLPACTETKLATRTVPVEVTQTRERQIDPGLLRAGEPFPRERIRTNGDLLDALEVNEATIRRLNCQLDLIGRLSRGHCRE